MTFLALHNFLLKYFSLGSRLFSLKALINQGNQGNTLLPMVINGISPAFPRLTDLLGIPPPLHLVRNKKQCISKRASWVLPGTPVAKDRKHLLCPASPMLDTVYLFLKLWWFSNVLLCSHGCRPMGLCHRTRRSLVNHLHSWTHSSSLPGSLINTSYKLDTRTLITLLNAMTAKHQRYI